MHFYWLVLAVLSVWRLTHLLVVEDGPWDLCARLRSTLGTQMLGRMFRCFYCLSLWIAAPTAALIGDNLTECLLLCLAISAGAVLIERATNPFHFTADVIVEDSKELAHDLLRQSEK